MISVAKKAVVAATSMLPASLLSGWLTATLLRKAQMLSPKDGLRLLFEVEAGIYPLEGALSVAYGNGVHTKHKHTRYHDFFIQRVKPGNRVLDIGCGIGALAHAVAEHGGVLLYGIDLSEKNIAQANRQFSHERVTFVVGDVLKDLPNENFDIAILSNVLEHLPDRSNFLKRVYQAVQAKKFLIRVPLYERDWRVPLKEEIGIEWRLDPTHETEYTLESFRDEMELANMEIVHLEVRWGEIWCEVQPSAKD